MYTNLINAVENKVIILTPTRRLAAWLVDELTTVLAKQSIAPSLEIYALEDWLCLLWQQFPLAQEQLLTKMQSLLRWEHMIQVSKVGKRLLNTQQMAKVALDAWVSLHHWLAVDVLTQKAENKDQEVFCSWAKEYQSWLTERSMIDIAQLPQKLLLLLLKSPSKKVLLYAFEEISPLMLDFFKMLKHQGWQIDYQEPPALTPLQLKRFTFQKFEQELKSAALWAAQRVKKEKAKIAIVIPNLTAERHKVETTFQKVLQPLQVCTPLMEVAKDFNISAALPLSQYPIIYAAIRFLKLMSEGTLADYISTVLDPFSFAANDECFLRVQYARILNLLDSVNWSFKQSIAHIQQHQAPPKWKKILLQLQDYWKQLPPKQSFKQWVNSFKQILQLIGWPGERSLSSVEYQLVKRWDELLNELSSCDSLFAKPDFTNAFYLVTKIAGNTLFQPENKGAPIQILGVLEAVGQHFDHVWVMGFHNEAWPAPCQPNPFIPIQLQRKLKMPHASPTQEMKLATQLTQRLKVCAQEVVFSYALWEKEKLFSLSELIREVPQATFEETGVVAFQDFITGCQLQTVIDNKAPPLSQEEILAANSHLLTLQTTCPFKAFAEIRLKAKRLNKERWFQPFEQGIIIHRILEGFWQEMKSQSELLALSQEALNQKIKHLIDKNLPAISMSGVYFEVEKIRLENLLHDYVGLEKQRPPFKVEFIEYEKTFELNNFCFTLRFDRLDKTDDNQVIIVDYKSGQFNLADWFGERLKMPQLPLYYLALDEFNPQAMLVIKVNSQGCSLEGLRSETCHLALNTVDEIKQTMAPSTWQELKDYWGNHLFLLAQAFYEGHAHLDPFAGKTTCQYCQLSALCRVGEQYG